MNILYKCVIFQQEYADIVYSGVIRPANGFAGKIQGGMLMSTVSNIENAAVTSSYEQVDKTKKSGKNNVTGNLINSIKPIGNNAPEGYYLSVQILSSAIQADGVNAKGTPAVVDAWGVEYNKTYKTISK